MFGGGRVSGGVFGVRHLAECFHCLPAVLLSLTERSEADWLSVTVRLLDIAQLQPISRSDQWQFSSAMSLLLCVQRSFVSVISAIWELLSYQTHFAFQLDHCMNRIDLFVLWCRGKTSYTTQWRTEGWGGVWEFKPLPRNSEFLTKLNRIANWAENV